MKKIFTILIILVMLLTSCGIRSVENMQNDETINFNISKYKEHGELSDGLVWVKKEFSDWDKEAETRFAYLDTNGKRKSPWFRDEKWREPRNCYNGYVILIAEESYERIFDYSKCVIYDKNFNEIARLNCRVKYNDNISNFDSQGYAYAVGFDEEIHDDRLYWIDSKGVHKFEYSENLIMVNMESLNKFHVSNDYFVAVDGSPDPDYLYTVIANIYDKKGNLIIDMEAAMRKYTDEFAITSAEVLDNNTIRIYFYGASKKKYVCTMNFNGDFVNEPKEV